MKYILNSMCKTIAGMRKEMVKSLFTLLATFCFVPSFAVEVEEAEKKPTGNDWTYDGTNHKLINEEEGYEYKLEKDDEWSATSPTATEAGTYKAIFRELESEGDGDTLTVKVTAKTVTLTWSKISLEYSGDSLKPTATFAAGEIEDADTKNVSVVVKGSINAGENLKATATLEGSAAKNYSIKNATQNFTIEKAVLTLTWDEQRTFVYDGTKKAPEITKVNGTKGNEKPTITVAGAINCGKYTATATLDEASANNYTIDDDTKSVSFTINQATIIATDFDAPTPKTNLVYTGSKLTLINEGKKKTIDGKLQYALGEGEYADTLPKAIDAATYKVYYKFVPESENYKSSEPAFVSVSIEKAKPVVNKVPSAVTGLKETGAELTLVNVEEADVKGGTLKYSLDGGKTYVASPTATEAGEYTVSFKVFGDDNHKDSVLTNKVKVTVTKDLTLTLSRADWTYGATPSTFQLAGNEGNGKVSYTYYSDKDLETLTKLSDGASAEGKEPTNVGTYYVKAEVAADGIYNAASAKCSFSIKKAEPVVEKLPSANKDLVEDGRNLALIDNSGKCDGGTLYYSLDGSEYIDAIPTAIKAGRYTVSFKVEGDKNHTDKVLSETVNVIVKKHIVLSMDNVERTYGNASGEFEGVKGNLGECTVRYTYYIDQECTELTTKESDGASKEGEEPTNAGKYYVKAVVDSCGIYLGDSITASLVINKGVAVFKAPQPKSDLSYTGKALVLATKGESTTVGAFKYSLDNTEDYKDTIPTTKDAGTHKIWYQFIPSDTNIAASKLDFIEVNVEKAALSLVWDNVDLKYNGSSQKPTVSDTIGLKENDKVTLTISGAGTTAGKYTATATLDEKSAKNYKISSNATKEFTISKSDASGYTMPTVNELTYNGTNQLLLTAGKAGDIAGTFKYLYKVDGKEKTLDTIPAAKNADTYRVGFYFEPTDTNYLASAVTYKDIKISEAKLTLEWGNTELVYNDKEQAPTVTWKGVIGNDDVKVEVKGAKKNVGENYEATATLTGTTASNYTLSSAKSTTEFSIVAAKIDRPIITKKEFIYTGKLITFVPGSDYYKVTGYANGTEPDTYPSTITPKDGYVWSDDETSTPIEVNFVIKRISVEYPDADTKSFVFNGNIQTYELKEDTVYTITGNKQKYVDTYTVTVALKDKDHYEWSDAKTDAKGYTFVISKGIVKSPKADSVMVYTYDGKEKKFDVTVFTGSVLNDSNAVGTDAGEYIRTVVLDMDEKGGYEWDDNTTKLKELKFVIEPQKVIIPEVKETDFIYNTKPFNFVVPEDTATVKRYKITMAATSATVPGTYKAVLSLINKNNYVWSDNTTADREINFKIGSGKIERPEIKTSYVYTGEEIVFVPANSAYTVKEGSGIDAKTYNVEVTPTENYTWTDGTKTPYEKKVKISEKPIEKPVMNTTTFTYTGEELFRIPTSDYYTLTGDTFGVEPRKYKATISLKKNYMWQDTTMGNVVFNIEIKKITVDVPSADTSKFIYNGKEQTYKIVANPVCKVTGNKQTNVGNYTVLVALDSLHYVWTDNTEADKSYKFVISRATVAEPVAVKSKFTFDGTAQNFEIVENKDYVVKAQNPSAVNVGVYERIVTLADSLNYSWEDGTTADKVVKFEIQPIIVNSPIVETEHVYTGSPIVFVEETAAYKVTNGTKTDADIYNVTVSLNPGYKWKDDSYEDKKIVVEIRPAYVSRPDIVDTVFVYNGKMQSFGFTKNIGYTFVGDTAAKEPGSYDVVVKLNKNYIWDNDAEYDINYTFVISRAEVNIPSANTTKFTYSGKEQIYTLEIPEDSLFTVSNNVKTLSGKYEVSVSLKDTIHYQWSDTTTKDKSYDFVISKYKVALPTTPLANFIYNGKEKEFVVNPSDYYTVNDSNAYATETGKYIRTAYLNDTENYIWADETSELKSITFTIGDGTIEVPEVKLEYTYTGDTIIFIPEDGSYTVTNGAKKNVGEYKVVMTPNKGYKLPGNLKDTTFYVVIKPIMVEKPVLQLVYTYNKKTIDFKVPVNEAYEIIGETSGLELGKYNATLDLKDNYMWADSTLGRVVYTFTINKIVVPIPPVDSTVFVYNGKRQTYNVAKSSNYNVLGNVQAYAGSYEVSVLLTDFSHSIWSDSTIEVKTYIFDIARAKVDLPEAVQSTYYYDGTIKYFNVVENSRYEVLSKTPSATEVGNYERTVSLKDTLNYTWSDGTVTDKKVTFSILNGAIDHPEVVTEYVYDGSVISFVPENNAYIVENGKQKDAGTYEVVVVLKAGYIWSDNTVLPDTHTVVIKPRMVEKPVFPTTSVYTYNDTIHGVVIPDVDGYTVEGITQTKEPGTYTVSVKLNPNYIWSDTTEVSMSYTYTINKIVVDIPAKIDSVFTFTGSEIVYPIVDTIDCYLVSGHHRTSAGLHTVTVSLSDSAHYVWTDSTVKDKNYEFLINKYKVVEPKAKVDTFVYDGNAKSFEVIHNDYYIVEEHSEESAIKPGVYTYLVSLVDTINTLWADGTIAYKEVNFYIVNGTIPSITVPTNLVYTGDTLTLIKESDAYTVENNKAVKAGTYNVVVTPKSGYVWASDGKNLAKTLVVKVAQKTISIPQKDTTEYSYNGKAQTYKISGPVDSLFTVSGNVQTKVGKYDVVVKLKDSINYCWTDSTIASKKYLFTINKQCISIPEKDTRLFQYTGNAQTYKISGPVDSLYTVTGNVQTGVGEYNVLVTLKDTVNYCWSDMSVFPKLYQFFIVNIKFTIDSIAQAVDMNAEVTPGNVAVLDVNISSADISGNDVTGSLFKYCIKCDSCPAFNKDTTSVEGMLNSIELQVPDSVKPGIYKIKVTLVSGTFETTQEVELKVNYPASDIYVVWNDVLTVDNSANLFQTYQWYKNGQPIPGATSQYYQEKNSLDGYYSCLVNGELFVGPAFFHVERPLWINAIGKEGRADIQIVGDIPAESKVGVYSLSGTQVAVKAAQPTMSFELPSNIYIVKFVATTGQKVSDQSVKIIVK